MLCEIFGGSAVTTKEDLEKDKLNEELKRLRAEVKRFKSKEKSK